MGRNGRDQGPVVGRPLGPDRAGGRLARWALARPRDPRASRTEHAVQTTLPPETEREPTATGAGPPSTPTGRPGGPVGAGAFGVVVAVLALVIACIAVVFVGRERPGGDAGGAGSTTATVELSEFALGPADVTVPVGGRLQVKNVGSVPHKLTVTATEL